MISILSRAPWSKYQRVITQTGHIIGLEGGIWSQERLCWYLNSAAYWLEQWLPQWDVCTSGIDKII